MSLFATRKRFLLLSLFSTAFLLPAGAGRAQVVSPPAVTTPAPVPAPVLSARQIAKGVQLLQIVLPDGAPGGPLLVTAVEIDPKASKEVRVEAALGQDRVWGTDPSRGRETVSSIVARHHAVAGINACFFPFTGVPEGLHVQGGEIVTTPGSPRTVFWIAKDHSVHFDALSYQGSVRSPTGETTALSGMNRSPAANSKAGNKDELLLYTPIFFSATLPALGRFEAALRISPRDFPLQAGRDIVATVTQTGENGGTPLEPGTVVLSGGGAGADFLRRATGSAGARLTLRLDLRTADGQPFDLSRVQEAVTGGPRLLTGGQVTVRTTEEGFGESFSTTHHPRSSVGVTRDGRILLVAVDGRQKGISGGISLADLAQRLQAMGCVDAMNLDGGGSTSLSVGGLVVNSPSEGIERPDASMLLVYAPPLAAKTQTSAAAPDPGPLHPGDSLPLPTPAALGAVWGTRGGIGYVTQFDGTLHATRPGKGVIAWVLPGSSLLAQDIPITVVGATTLDKAGFQCKLTLTADPGSANHATLAIHIANAEGDPLASEPTAVAVTGGTPDSPTVTTDGRGNAHVGITWNAAGDPSARMVTVTSPASRFTAATVKG